MTASNTKTNQPTTVASTKKMVRATKPAAQPTVATCNQRWGDRQPAQVDQNTNTQTKHSSHIAARLQTLPSLAIHRCDSRANRLDVANLLCENTFRGWMAKNLTVKQLKQLQKQGADGIAGLASHQEASAHYYSYPDIESASNNLHPLTDLMNANKTTNLLKLITLVVHTAAQYYAVDPMLIEAVVLRERRELRADRQLARAPYIKAKKEMVNRQNRDFEARLRQIFASGALN